MSKIITIKEANISTLAVELKAIHINSKQMTLSVFRQIQEEKVYDEEFEFQGNPWGLVNYYWDKAYQFNDSVIHVVWQKGSELRRDRVTHPKYEEKGLLHNNIYRFEREKGEIKLWLEQDYPYNCPIFEKHRLRRPEYYGRYSTNSYEEERAKSIKLKYELNDRNLLLDSQITKTTDTVKKYIIRWEHAYKKLAQLPQLYIAA